MALGDGIRRNIAQVEPSERALFRDAMKQLNHRFFGGSRTDSVPGGVSWWFKQDEIHQATHVHGGPEFVPWHREICNRLEEMLRQINPRLSLHYWDWTQDPRAIPNANLGGGTTGTLNLFTADFMGYGGTSSQDIGEPWLSAGYYDPATPNDRDVTDNPADPPAHVVRSVNGSPASAATDTGVVNASDFPTMSGLLESVHNSMHGFVNMGGAHISFRDPFVFMLHSNMDRLFALWQTQAGHSARLDPATIYGTDTAALSVNVEPWSTGHSVDSFGSEHFTRPWYAPESQGAPHTYLDPSVVFPPCYDTNAGGAKPIVRVLNAGTPPVLNFNDVPSGDTAVRAAIFRVFSCVSTTIRVKAGFGPAAPFSVLQPVSGSVTVPHDAHQFVDVRIWLAYTAGAAGVPVADGAVTFECPESGQTFPFVIKANAIARPRVAVMLSLDQSGSMDDPAGTSGAKRIDVLKDAARTFAETIQQNHGVGLIRFDHDAYPVNDATFPGLAVTRILSNDIFDVGRVQAIQAVNNHHTNPAGSTSVGDGVELARQVLNTVPAADYDQKAMIVLTDGLENTPKSIAEVIGSIDNRTFAIGLGNEFQVNTTALRQLANSTGGYLLLTGLLSSSIDDYFRLRKYFLQILAGVTNTSVIVDPAGYIAPGTKIRIPFVVNEADIDCTALLMTDFNVVDMALETPHGETIDSASAAGVGVTHNFGTQSRIFRFTLPVAIGSGARGGGWNVVLTVNRDEFLKTISNLRERQKEQLVSFATHGARYCVTVQTYSNLRMTASIEQGSYTPGSDFALRATLCEYGLPVERRARVEVELTRPGGSVVTAPLAESEPGIFEGNVRAPLGGVYHARFLARGVTLRGTPFTREQLASAAVWSEGNQPYTPSVGTQTKDDLCRFLRCLLSDNNLTGDAASRLKKLGVNLDGIRKCIAAFCSKRG
jgi:hypothetical protein